MTTTYTFDLSKYARCGVKTVVLKETTGADEDRAAEIAKQKGLTGNLTEELIRLAVISYDGQPAIFPFTQFDTFTKRTRDLIAKSFSKVNGTSGLKGLELALEGTPDGASVVFDLSAIPLCSLKTIALREVTGRDEDDAIRKSISNKTSYREELFKLSVVSIDGDPNNKPDLKEMNSRTLSIVMGAFAKMNSVDADEMPEPEAAAG